MILGIDTSGAVSVAVADEDRILAVRTDDRARHHDEVLLPLIQSAMDDAGAARSDLTEVVVGRGPGPFTGLRVGLVTARSIAAVLRLRLRGLCSLDALALQAAEQDPLAGTVGVALDARRREVYAAAYRIEHAGEQVRVHRTLGPTVAAPADAAAELTGCDALVGAGAHLYAEQLPPTADLRHVDAGFLIRAANQQVRDGDELGSTDPLYLREPDAAKPTGRKSTLGKR
ncbi:tRNA (adenosine(37)-N6)-threonylcarbamoyltransferase complex dimerization subunit type 1 TsaB [Helcobacillus massiliensis]|uniref:tRNA threonylcarbamoyl adenosine modification protein YeaZ n=1 Tax=Helcobacillus massiliensis TaxID=521392 RepID=A0A839QQY6_9MICO|nr:tRNA (adenosine(37)-N6)-threonylcarbamoyltransferase complex dimerization subunit type 1 TsaB [Helcobacillus massiliensis]MBB3022883.1 tRNA threonylcarbamoyl adenosine modification protein YeaZ [Helcobacillus massiliensis]